MNKKENGITLIALVITIIVLLILAGVAIAMLSGENGILKKAAEAKTETEQAQIEEEARLIDMELTTFFATNNMKYKCSNGYITGFNVNGSEVEESVEKFEEKLEPLGYKINLRYKYDYLHNTGEDVEIDDKTIKIATGMSVQKDGETIARTIVFADVKCDSGINTDDLSPFVKYTIRDINVVDFMKVAMDVNCDGKINGTDNKLIKEYLLGGAKINQNQYASNPKKIIEDKESCIRYRYISSPAENNLYTLEYNEMIDRYNFRVKSSESIKAEDLLNTLPANGKIKRNGEEVAANENVQNGDEVVCVSSGKEIPIGKIIIE